MKGEDRLSDLPEPILHHIFSFLPTKEVVRSTCLLSKNWTHFSASFPYLFFSIKDVESSYYFDNAGEVARFHEDCRFPCLLENVEGLLCRAGSDLHRLRLRWWNCEEGSQVKYWISEALKRNVQELDIFLGVHKTMFTVPAKVFATASSVKVIKLESRFFHFHFLVPRPMLLAPNVRTLELIKVKLPKGDLKGELILRCPVLETLILNKCYYKHLKVVNLSVARLKKLEIDNKEHWNICRTMDIRGPGDRLGDCVLELHTPNLSTFVYKGVMFKDCSLGKLGALIDVDLELCKFFLKGLSCLERFAESKDSRYVKLLKGLNGARTLTLKLPELQFTLEELLASYANLKKLELQASIYSDTYHTWLASLLRLCSPIETLVLDIIPFHHESNKDGLALPPCQLNRLKSIVVRGVEGDNYEFELLRLLLNIAVNLEILTIMTRGRSKTSKIERDDLLSFQDKVMELSHDFPNVEVSFQIL